MSNDKAAEARAEAERRFAIPADDEHVLVDTNQVEAFVAGVQWADANPQPHTITRSALRDTAMMLAHTRQDEIEAMLPGLLGIEVTGDE